MRSRANLQLTVFEGLRGLSTNAKLLYFALLVEPTLNQAGVGALRERRWARETELTVEEVRAALAELDAQLYALVDADTEEILVRTMIRRDGVAEKPNLLRAACRAAVMVESPRLRAVLAAELRKLPPRPKPSLGKDGRLYEHPDPHATAAEIDPSDGPDGPPGGTVPEPFPNGSRTVREPIPEPSPDGSPPVHDPAAENRRSGEPFANGSTGAQGNPRSGEPFPEPIANQSRTISGGGGGGGSGSCSVVGHLSSSHARARARDAAATDLDATPPGAWRILNPWRATHDPPYRTATYRQLAGHVTTLLAAGADPHLIRTALDAWDSRTAAKPGLLPHLYDDAVHSTRRPRLRIVDGSPTVPVADLTDDEINPDDVLGPDTWQPPPPPPDIDDGPREQRRAWFRDQVAARRRERVAEARERLTRRQGTSA